MNPDDDTAAAMRTYRAGRLDDLPFIVEALMAAERSGSSFTVYERAFGMKSREVEQMFARALNEDVPGSELCCANFWLVLENGERAGCIACWIEGEDAQSSAMIRATILAHVLGADLWKAGQERIRALASIDIPRSPGTVQIEAVYVAEQFRGRALVAALIDHALSVATQDHPEVLRAQIQSVIENVSSARAFGKAGFTASRRTQFENAAAVDLFPGSGRVLWERVLA